MRLPWLPVYVHRIGCARIRALCFAVMLIAVGGCTSGGTSPNATSPAQSSAQSPAQSSAGTGTASQTATDDIPAGRSIAEGGGGPLTYTFREEWRRARDEARKWRPGAYLITAAGEFVNDDGVPSHWSLYFIDKVDADAVLIVEIDPWGKVSSKRELTGSDVSSFVGKTTKKIPYGIIDSDKAVELGKAALAAKFDLARTKDPRLGLNFSLLDGSGPYWNYTLFNNPTATYVTAHVDALTGAVKVD